MAQGKLKIKSSMNCKLPNNIKAKKQARKDKIVSKRSNKPIQSKKKGIEEVKKLKKLITKTVNKSLEDEIRARASDQKTNYSKAQQAVVEHHNKQAVKRS